jgi:serine/threonine-protein kinase
VDFGLAKANSQLEKSEPGIIKGKFSYLSPEAAMGQEVDARTDVFAVGIILWELLAGQRLFLGDTDFQTVKKVQAANVPPVSAINKKVPQDLERIIAKSLARDPTQRYAGARPLGQDLSKFLFKYGVPVSTFDIASLVQGAMKERARRRPAEPSIIDKLIEEALLEFTSLTDDKAPSGGARPVEVPGMRGSKAPSPGGGYVDVGSWIDEIGAGGAARAKGPSLDESLPQGLAVGNLAALEDEDPSSPAAVPLTAGTSAASSAPPPMAHPPMAGHARAPMQQSGLPGSLDRKSAPSTLVGVLVAVAVVMAAGAAAWFTHLIPHSP